jgi:hypothetical protein
MPENATEARRWLTMAIEEEVSRLTLIRAQRQRFADVDWAEAPARLAFETGTEGDRLRRYDLSRDRELVRAVGKFLDVRKASVAGTFDLLDYGLDAVMEFDGPHDPTASHRAAPPCDIGPSTLAADGGSGKSVELSAGSIDTDEDLEAQVDREKASRLLWDEVARRAPSPTEDLRKLNEESRKEAKEARAAAGRSRPVEHEHGELDCRGTVAVKPSH